MEDEGQGDAAELIPVGQAEEGAGKYFLPCYLEFFHLPVSNVKHSGNSPPFFPTFLNWAVIESNLVLCTMLRQGGYQIFNSVSGISPTP